MDKKVEIEGSYMSIEISNAEQYISWLNTAARLNSIAAKAAKRFVKRGQVYWCHFGLNIGSEISKTTQRPAVVVSNWSTNERSSNIIVVPFTHNQRQLSSLVPIDPITDGDGNIILDGQADTANILCVSKARLGDQITALSAAQMKEIDKSISLSLELKHYYDAEAAKYQRLSQYTQQVKTSRNEAQDTLKQLRQIIAQDGFSEDAQEKIKELLDIR